MDRKRRHVGSLEVLPQLIGASFLCSAAIVEFTVPQIIKLSASGQMPLPSPTFGQKCALFGRSIAPQTAITTFQFVLVRELREALDGVVGAHPVNLSLAYGTASVPLIAGKYNLLTADVYSYFGRKQMATEEGMGALWRKKVQPGLLWSYIRDCGAVGGGIVLGPLLSQWIIKRTEGQQQLEGSTTAPSMGLKFVSGVVTGSVCGLVTQLFHNAALTAGTILHVVLYVVCIVRWLQCKSVHWAVFVVHEHGVSVQKRMRYRRVSSVACSRAAKVS